MTDVTLQGKFVIGKGTLSNVRFLHLSSFVIHNWEYQ